MCVNKKTFINYLILITAITTLINTTELITSYLITNISAVFLIRIITIPLICIIVIKYTINTFSKELNYDYLTKLYNRRKLFIDLNSLIKKNNNFTLCFIDLNNFKHINDTYGHETGDMFLKKLANYFKSIENSQVKAYRLGGDEFVIIINTNNICDYMGKVSEISRESITIGKRIYDISFSIGTVNNDFKSTADELILKADRGMYRNKSNSKKIRKRDM